MRVRFIEGKAAGREIQYPDDLPFVKVPIHSDLKYPVTAEAVDIESLTIEEELYKVESIRFGDMGEQKYGINPNTTIRDAFNELWYGYRKSVK